MLAFRDASVIRRHGFDKLALLLEYQARTSTSTGFHRQLIEVTIATEQTVEVKLPETLSPVGDGTSR